MRQEIDLGLKRYEALSLLWKNIHEKKSFHLTEQDILDLNLQNVQCFFENEYKMDMSSLISEMPTNKEDSIYRQQVMIDLTRYDNLYEILIEYGQKAHHLMTLSKFAFEREATVYNLIKRMGEVESIRQMVEAVFQCISNCNLESEGLIRYRSLLFEIVNSRIYEAFTEDVRYIKSLENGVKSVRIGLNLDEYLQPIEAILLEISDEEFKYSRFGKKVGYYLNYGLNELKLIPRKLFAAETVLAPEPLNSLEKTLEPATLQLITFCDQFNMKILEVLSILYHELPYYKIGVILYQKLQHNMHPTCLPKWNQELYLKSLYNINLGINNVGAEIVKNDMIFDINKPIILLTGANRGGKTTLTQAISQAILFAQLGFYIPAQEGSLPYVDALMIHFPMEETKTVNYGRLGEECKRFKQLFDQSTSQSFYFMNESFSGTSHHESLQIAIETLKAIYKKGSFVLFNTHLHELLEELEKELPKDSLVSYIAGKDMKKSPYFIEEGRPLGRSYALDIAKKYGMTYEQLIFDES